MTNFIPSDGVPSSDAWFVCFDTVNTFIPSMFIGRLPVKDGGEAEKTVSKIVGYDATPRGDWTKSFMFMTAGFSDDEKAAFNYNADQMIETRIVPLQLGAMEFVHLRHRLASSMAR